MDHNLDRRGIWNNQLWQLKEHKVRLIIRFQAFNWYIYIYTHTRTKLQKFVATHVRDSYLVCGRPSRPKLRPWPRWRGRQVCSSSLSSASLSATRLVLMHLIWFIYGNLYKHSSNSRSATVDDCFYIPYFMAIHHQLTEKMLICAGCEPLFVPSIQPV
jgi:hypothetical protein